ncbi:MAG: helix-turn-helix transcriptional regulator [Bacteroidetes bacterium]|nr:helix-turn-helix transcriptional regulator [Bacteroidota bacterium]
MLASNVLNLLEARGISRKDASAMLRSMGFNSPITKAIMSGRRQNFTLHEIEILCIHLHCTPSDLFIYQPERHHKLPPDHPLLRIKSGKPLPKLSKTIASLPVELLNKLQEYADSLQQPPQP